MSDDTFGSILGSVKRSGESFEARVPNSWMQGRATFGGLVAALAVEAMQQTLVRSAPLRAIQVLFVGPVGDAPIEIQTSILRQGKNVTAMRADVVQSDQVCCSVMASFGTSRQSKLAVNIENRPEVDTPESLAPFNYIEGVTPAFTQKFDMRWAEGDRPFTNCQDTEHGIWARFYEEGQATNTHLIAIADIPPPIGLSMLTEPANGSSLTWSLEFLTDEWQANMHDWWYIKTQLMQCSQGYAQQAYTIWLPNGQAIALGRQVMTVFA